jgi:short subunit dehydrogenase-like uncharacterized protein
VAPCHRLRRATLGGGRIVGHSVGESLRAAFAGADVVVNCAGPFTPTGRLVAQAAIDAGSHYLDTAGEQSYIKALHDELNVQAKDARATVVPAITDGGICGDLLAHELGARLGPLDTLVVAHLVVGGGGPSRGTLRSALTLAATSPNGGLAYDHGIWRTGAEIAPTTLVPPGAHEPAAFTAFPLPEIVTIPRHVRVGQVSGVIESGLADRLAGPIDPRLIDQLPQGPTPQARGTQRFTVLVQATAADGRTVRGIARGTDTYGTTARLVAESAVRIARQPNPPSGVLSPTEAFSPDGLLEIIEACGVTCAYVEHG